MAAAWGPARQVGECSAPSRRLANRATAAMFRTRVTREAVHGCSSQVRRVTQKPETNTRHQTPDTRPRCQTPDHQTTRPPNHQTPASPDHPCTLPPGLAQSRGRGGGDEARTALEALRRLHACAARPVPQPAEKKILCVCVCVCAGPDSRRCRGLPPRVARELHESCTGEQGRREVAGRLRGAAARHGCPPLHLAQGGACALVVCMHSRPKAGSPTPAHTAPFRTPAGSCSSARTPTAPPTWPPTCKCHGATEWLGSSGHITGAVPYRYIQRSEGNCKRVYCVEQLEWPNTNTAL